MNAVKSANDPQALLKSMASNNPDLKNTLDIIKENGNDPKAAFYKKAKEMGVNPDDILNLLK